MSEFPVNVITQAERAAPGATASTGKFYTKDVSGVTQQFYQASDGTEYQLAPVQPGAGSVTYAQQSDQITLRATNTTPNDTNVNALFPSGRNAATLAANSTYRFRGEVHAVRVTGTSPVPTLVIAGTAAYSSINFTTHFSGGGTFNGIAWTNTTSLAMAAANGNTVFEFMFQGIVVTSTGGTFVPSMSLSIAPGSVFTMQPSSYCELILLGNNTYTKQGGWV